MPNPEITKLENDILKKSKKFGYKMSFIKKGISTATDLHKDQKRRSGEPYIIHPLNVAYEIVNLNLGEDAVVAALLHDVIEDCDVTKEQIEKDFNATVANLVEGVTKLDELTNNSIKRYTEIMNLRKLIIASSSDIRVLLIKLADRLHNMRTIDTLNPAKPHRKVEYSDETLKVYVPLAEYIGIGKWKRDLEDIAFKNKNPEFYTVIQDKILKDQRVHNKILDQLLSDINKILKSQKLDVKEVYGRIKSVHSTFFKALKYIESAGIMDPSEIDISRVKDLIGASIILNSDEIECYRVLGLIHNNFEYSAKNFDDYIAKPKGNGYRALQTTIFYQDCTAEIQIKTAEMHEVNEFGPASHIAYKMHGSKSNRFAAQFSWIKNLNLWREKKEQTVNDENIYKFSAFEDKIFVITPKGKVVELPKDSSPIDFAYLIHTDIGDKFVGAKINGKVGKVSSILKNGDVVEILTSNTQKRPSIEWLKYAKLSSTKQKIKRNLTVLKTEENIDKGKKALSQYIQKSIKIDWFTLDSGIIRSLLGEIGIADIDQFYINIALGNTQKKDILKILVKKLNIQTDLTQPKKISKKSKVSNGELPRINIEGVSDLSYVLAGCCKPILGDEIIGIVTLRDGLKIHRTKCKEIEKLDAKRILKAKWE